MGVLISYSLLFVKYIYIYAGYDQTYLLSCLVLSSGKVSCSVVITVLLWLGRVYRCRVWRMRIVISRDDDRKEGFFS
jgi:hypothetical protein